MENELSAGTSFNTGSCFALSSSIRRRLVVAVAPRALYFLKYSILIHVVIIAYVLNPMGISIYLVPVPVPVPYGTLYKEGNFINMMYISQFRLSFNGFGLRLNK